MWFELILNFMNSPLIRLIISILKKKYKLKLKEVRPILKILKTWIDPNSKEIFVLVGGN
ncbi:MAG: hypothetical protein ACRCZO_14740 [Cetobacterium sp.]